MRKTAGDGGSVARFAVNGQPCADGVCTMVEQFQASNRVLFGVGAELVAIVAEAQGEFAIQG